MTRKTDLSNELRQFVEFKELNNEFYTRIMAEKIFNYNKIQQVFKCGLSYKFYNSYGISELDFVYEQMTQEEFAKRIEIYTRELFIKNFKKSQFDKLEDETNVAACKLIMAFIGFSQREAIRNIVINEAKEKYPYLSCHYLNKYVKLRNFGIELRNYDVFSISDIKMLEDFAFQNRLNINASNIYGMYKAFGYITPEEELQLKRKYRKCITSSKKNNSFDKVINDYFDKELEYVKVQKGLSDYYCEMLKKIMLVGLTLDCDDEKIYEATGLSTVTLKRLRNKVA